MQIFVDDELLDTALIHIGICPCLRAVVCLDPAEDFLIAFVLRLCVQERFILMIQVHSCIHVQKDILTVWKSLDIQTEQDVHEPLA